MGHTPYGYKIENGKAVIDEEKAEQIRQLYEGYLSGLGLTDAANHAGLSIPHRQAKNGGFQVRFIKSLLMKSTSEMHCCKKL